MKLRPVSPLVIESDTSSCYASSPRTAHRVRIHPAVAELLLSAREGIEVTDEMISGVGGGQPPESAIPTLFKLGYLVDADLEAVDAPQPWRQWGTLAWAFHEHVRDAHFIRRGSADEVAWQRKLEQEPPLPPTQLQKTQRGGEAILLPRIRADLEVSFRQVLETRRTHRRFRDVPVDLVSFATLLHYSFAPMRFADGGELGVMEFRANASGGSRHETSACVAVFNVADIDQGLYVYDGIRHGLVPLRHDIAREKFDELTGYQGFYASAFGVITVCDATRMSWKYRNPRAYRHLMNNVGTFAQVFSMVAIALGLGAAITGAVLDSAFDRILGLDAPREFATFSMSCGTPDTGPGSMPSDYRAPRRPFSV